MLRQTTAAGEEPVTVAEARKQLAVIHPAHDDEIESLIRAARETVERLSGCALVRATYEWTPVGSRTEPLPLWPGKVLSDPGVYPIVFEAEPGEFVPEALKRAILLRVSDLFENRSAGITGTTHTNNPAFMDLIFLHRRILP